MYVFFPVKANLNFQQPLQETFIIIIIAENSFLFNIFVETDAFFHQDYLLIIRLFKRTLH